MSENNIKSRIQLKNDTEANWLKAINFTPKKGEIIVYNIDDAHDTQRIKIGDGERNINDLPFLSEGEVAKATAEVAGIMKLYSEAGEAEDGTMTQKAIGTSLAKKADLVGGKVDPTQLPDDLVVSKDVELPEIDLKLNADLLQGFDANYFATKDELKNIQSFRVQISETVPDLETAQADTIYLVPRTEEDENDKYDEYILANTVVEKIGGSLSKKQLSALLAKASKYIVPVQSPSWTAEGDLFKTTVIIPDMAVAGDNYGFIADVFQTGDAELDAAARENYSLIVRMTINGKQLTIYSEEEFESLKIQLIVFYVGENSGGSSGGTSFNVEIVETVPAPELAIEGVFYLVAKENGKDDDLYDEYVYVKKTNKMERIGGGNDSEGINIKEADITLTQNSFVYNGESHAPGINTISYKGTALKVNIDYGVLLSEARDAGSYSVLVFGIGNYTGLVGVPWTIEKAPSTVTISKDNLTIKGVMGTSDSTITASKTGDGTFEVESLSPTFVRAELVGGTVKITSVKPGQGTVRVKTVNGKNYADAHKDITVTTVRADGSISIQPTDLKLSGEVGTEKSATLSITGDGAITLSAATHCTVKREGTTVTATSVSEGDDTITITMAQTDNYTGSQCTLHVEVVFKVVGIWGVKWDGSSNSQLTRTDDAVLFDDPTPAISNGSGSSPFDEIEPWSAMTKVTKDGNTFVAIPKFWYKITNNGGTGITIQIANYEADGFKVSPAHMNRNDGVGERDWMYVGRYHCASDYKSKSGTTPVASKTRSAFRTGITGLGDGYCMWDYAMWKTIQMLYLVEFAHWDSQLKIGFGCGNNSSTENMGSTDTMTYHTGTKSSSRETYAVGTQYRYIEGLWDNIYDWLDGITYSSNSVYVGIEPSKYNDSTSSYTNVGKASSGGWISAWGIPSQSGYEWAIYPSTCSGGETTYVCDNFDSSDPCCLVGGYYNQNRYRGLFFSSSGSASSSGGSIGARIQYFPKAGEILS